MLKTNWAQQLVKPSRVVPESDGGYFVIFYITRFIYAQGSIFRISVECERFYYFYFAEYIFYDAVPSNVHQMVYFESLVFFE